LRPEQQFYGFEDMRLIVGNQNTNWFLLIGDG